MKCNQTLQNGTQCTEEARIQGMCIRHYFKYLDSPEIKTRPADAEDKRRKEK